MSSQFRRALEEAVLSRHCANHPMTEKWARGELSRRCLKGVAVEHWHWISHAPEWNFTICAKAPRDVINMQLQNWREEADDKKPHLEIILRFAKANGADIEAVRKGRGLPTTRALVDFRKRVAHEEPWWCAIASGRIGTESQSPMLYGKVLHALRHIYKYSEEEMEHFSLHSDVDIEHSGRAFDILEKHCKTGEMQEQAVHYAREGARMRWFYFDGIYLHYEMGYDLQ